MKKRILIDATHVEETRVVVLENGRICEFDSETSIKKQIKGNIYLAKVTRVEPSLQAAFVEYGEGKHGFLPFVEIHPDYYSIPTDDKQELLASIRSSKRKVYDERKKKDELEEIERSKKSKKQKENLQEVDDDEVLDLDPESEIDSDVDVIDNIDDDDTDDGEVEITKELNLYKKYKIQEVIKRNQIILVQVQKEERGNKGASLTSFISLAGRYCVLMPNSIRQGGVSRKIANYEGRKRLKKIIDDLNLPEDKGIIIRTAGSEKSAQEIKNDYNYLASLWNDIRQLTLSSDAPAFILGESDIIKRTVRDLFDNSISEVLIEGAEAYKNAVKFAKVMMPENSKKFVQYKNKVPIFARYRVEEQIMSLYSQKVPLESGGSLVITPTEALISIDVNSGKYTSHRNVEETAIFINLEAAKEIARQLKLRDLSGLIVIDFIDMLDYKNRRLVEKTVRQAFQNDKAKIQIGRISNFGLLEISRQRLSSSFFEVNTMVCEHCNGSGLIRAPESISVTVLRAIENEASKSGGAKQVNVYVATDVIVYILNYKRNVVSEIEKRYKTKIMLNAEDSGSVDSFSIERIVDKDNLDAKAQPQIDNKDKKKSADHSNDNKEPAKNTNKKSAASAFGGIFDGLWKKIID